MRKICLLLACLFFAAPLHAADLADRDWSVGAPKSLITVAPAPEDVAKLVNKAVDANWEMKLCSYSFADLGHDGHYELIASLDVSGRHSCKEMVVIGKTGSKIAVLNNFKVDGIENASSVLHDDDSGVTLAAFSENWELFEGAGCKATWVHVYKWEQGRFVDRSSAYPDIYQSRLSQLKAIMPRLEEPLCAQMEADRIARFLGTDPTAGYTEATEWMHSDKGPLRRKAAAVFADINDAASRKNLAKLENDSDPLVAEAAKVYAEAAASPKE